MSREKKLKKLRGKIALLRAFSGIRPTHKSFNKMQKLRKKIERLEKKVNEPLPSFSWSCKAPLGLADLFMKMRITQMKRTQPFNYAY